MSWFNKKQQPKIKTDLKLARERLDKRLSYIKKEYSVKVEEEDSPVLEIISVGDKWLEVIEGINVVEPEFPYRENDEIIFLINAKKGSKIGPHRHNKKEFIYIVEGIFKDTVSNEVYASEEIIKYKPLVPHGMEFIEDCIIVVHWKNK